MKKLMLIAAVVCAAAVSQAASFSWSTNAKVYGPAVDLANLSAGSVASGTQNAQRLDNFTAISWAYVLALSSADGSDTLTLSPTYSLGKAKQSVMSSDLIYNPTEGELSVNYVLTITGTYTDASGNDWTFVGTDTGANKFSSLSTLEIQTGVPSSWTVTGSTTPTPEPTSGLLLLLGMAGLALKRRRV